MRYLLDELMAYEEGFIDILMGDWASDRHETFMGKYLAFNSFDASAFVGHEDLQEFQNNLMGNFTALITPRQTTSEAVSTIEMPTPQHRFDYPTPKSQSA